MKTIKLIGVIVMVLVFLVGCAASQIKKADLPMQPNIHWMFDTDGVMCVTPQDSILLFQYMEFLKERAKAAEKMLIY